MKVRADAKGLPLTLEAEGDVPQTIMTDPIRLRQILVNLVGNAIKFTELGSVRVVMRSLPASNGKGKLSIDVIDTGIGMAKDEIGLLFRPFSQSDNSATRRLVALGWAWRSASGWPRCLVATSWFGAAPAKAARLVSRSGQAPWMGR